MIELGKIQKLEVVRVTEHGAYLNTTGEKVSDDILLPLNQAPQGTEIGNDIDVFVYKDSEDRVIATVKKPNLTVGELAVLKVAEITKIGAFLDWGLDKDLFLPYKEQIGEVKKDKEYLVSLYVDNSSRLCATMRVYPLLSSSSPYKEKDRVHGIVINVSAEWGCFVAVDNKYHGLIYTKELYGEHTIGDKIDARVKKVRPDGKLELSMREPAFKEIEGDAQLLMEKLKINKGTLTLNDSSSPESIKTELNMSKSAFKRAVGRLLKEGAIKITDTGIEAMWKV
jgi:predicted RNA-binding protein (virulence factor B family)